MAYFAVFATDKPGMGAVRAELRPGHRTRLRDHDHPVTVVIGGPTLDDTTGAMNGTLLVIEAADIAQVRAFMAGDPYVEAGLFESLVIRPFNWGLNPPSPA